jgi:hypothetical protein
MDSAKSSTLRRSALRSSRLRSSDRRWEALDSAAASALGSSRLCGSDRRWEALDSAAAIGAGKLSTPQQRSALGSSRLRGDDRSRRETPVPAHRSSARLVGSSAGLRHHPRSLARARGPGFGRIHPGKYTLRATGWVKVVSGVQSLVSVYLLAIWALTYFGRPFD